MIIFNMTPQELFNEIRTYCQANANEAIVRKYAKYFKEGFDAYGLTRELLENKVDEIIKREAVDIDLVYQTSPLLLKAGKYEETSFAILLLNAFSRQFDKTTFIEIGKWFDIGITNWGHTDALCAYFFREFFKRKIIPLEDLSPWREATNKYQRRAVPVALIEILRAKGDFDGLLEFIDPMMPDPERVVHQGLGWFLREAWKRYPEPVESFLMKWKDSAARLIFQYATEKMSKEYRLKFRKNR
jgi:3-methyladenine DNA glycosylase AlkD